MEVAPEHDKTCEVNQQFYSESFAVDEAAVDGQKLHGRVQVHFFIADIDAEDTYLAAVDPEQVVADRIRRRAKVLLREQIQHVNLLKGVGAHGEHQQLVAARHDHETAVVGRFREDVIQNQSARRIVSVGYVAQTDICLR